MSVNAKNDAVSYYYSGQGVLMIGQRDANGNAGALIPVGNVSSLKIMVGSSVADHKGSQDGQRAIDKRLITETKGTISFDMESINSANLAMCLRGTRTYIPASSVSGAADVAYTGAVTNLPYANVSSLVVTQAQAGFSSGAMTEYVDANTAWDYKWNQDAGSFQMNSGVGSIGPVKAGIAMTGVPVATVGGSGATASVPITGLTAWPGYAASSSPITVGDKGALWGVTGAGAATVNGIEGTVTAVSASTLSITVPGAAGVLALSTSTVFIPTIKGSTGLPFPMNVTVAYTYTQQKLMDALVTAQQEMFLRFEGLNTAEADSSNSADFSPVIVEVFKFSVDPLKELDLISDAFGKCTVEGAILSDSTKTSGSKFFTVKMLN